MFFLLYFSVIKETYSWEYSSIFFHFKKMLQHVWGIVSDTSISVLPDLPNDMAWGTKKKIFYDSDYIIKSKHFFILSKNV